MTPCNLTCVGHRAFGTQTALGTYRCPIVRKCSPGACHSLPRRRGHARLDHQRFSAIVRNEPSRARCDGIAAGLRCVWWVELTIGWSRPAEEQHGEARSKGNGQSQYRKDASQGVDSPHPEKSLHALRPHLAARERLRRANVTAISTALRRSSGGKTAKLKQPTQRSLRIEI